MGFVKFVETGRAYVAKASIYRSGMISFTAGARKRFKMEEYKFVVLYFDSETQKIAIELTNSDNAAGALKLRMRVTGADIPAKGFCEFFNLNIKDTKSCELDVDKDGKIILDLKSARVRKTKKRETE